MVHPIHTIPLIISLSILGSPALACNPQWGACAGSTGFPTQADYSPPQTHQPTQQWLQQNQQRRQQQEQANRPVVVPKGHFGGTR